MPQKPDGCEVVVRRLREEDIEAADHIMRIAFGTFVGIPDPITFFGDACWVRPQWRSDPEAAFVAEMDGRVVGSNFATVWGSFGFFGPITTHPDVWGQGVGSKLMEPIMDVFAERGVRLAGLFTFPHSPKHIGLYQKFGFRPRFLTAIMAREVGERTPALRWSLYSQLAEREAAVEACRELTDAIHSGLDVSIEVDMIQTQALGDTLLVWDDSRLVALAACHSGAGTEAGSGSCFVKFGGVRPGPRAAEHFTELLAACDRWAASKGAARVLAGVSTARVEAYEQMCAGGFRTQVLGIAMHRPDEPGFSRPGVYVLDDWR